VLKDMGEMLTVKQVAEVKGCSVRYIRKIIENGKLQAAETLNDRNRKKYLVPLEALDENLQQKWYRMNPDIVPLGSSEGKAVRKDMGEMLTVKQVAEVKGCSVQYIRKIIENGKLKAEETLNDRNRKKYLVPLEALDENLQQKWYRMNPDNVPQSDSDDGKGIKMKIKKQLLKYFDEFSEEECFMLLGQAAEIKRSRSITLEDLAIEKNRKLAEAVRKFNDAVPAQPEKNVVKLVLEQALKNGKINH
jgi:excisionase family DNA binding protein